MEVKIGEVLIKLVKGDITDLDVDAIVNPANSALQLGGGVAGRIRQVGGEIIQEECNKLGKCPLGEAVVTSGGKLKAKYVIHAVGPRFNIDKEAQKYLSMAVKNSIKRAEEKKLTSLAIPAISTGIFGYPVDEAAHVILNTILECAKNLKYLKYIVVCLYTNNDLKIFSEALKKLL
jgi:O-acetyl-ADP-ribose deacetylase (regulator of RNase III)